MTQPQYAPQFPQMPQAPPQVDPQQPQYAQPQYAPPQQAYAPPQPQVFPQPQGYPQYAPQMPQGYPMPQPAPQLAAGTIDQFFAQPAAGGGAALKFEVGTRHIGIVSRPITNGDIQQQTQPGSGLPAFYKDGRPKFVMKVPLQIHQTPQHPDGQAQWYCAGQASTELQRAMAEVGAPEGPPEAGAVIDITCTHTRPSGQGMNPAKNYRIVYQRPNGAAPVAQQPPAPVAVTPENAHALAAAGVPLPANPVYAAAGSPPQLPPQQPPAPPVAQAPQQPPTPAQMPQQVAPQQPPAQPAPPVAPPPVPAGAVDGLSPQQQALLAQLTGQQQAQT